MRNWYVTTNVLAPVAGMHKENAIATALTPIFSNMEYGVTLSGGYLKEYHGVELRASYGSSNPYDRIPQIQGCYHFYITDYFKHNGSGWYLGGSMRYWMYQNIYTDTKLNNVNANATIGYSKQWNHLLCDLRMNLPLAVYSSSNISHTTPGFELSTSAMPEFSPVLPFFSLNIGYAFKSK